VGELLGKDRIPRANERERKVWVGKGSQAKNVYLREDRPSSRATKTKMQPWKEEEEEMVAEILPEIHKRRRPLPLPLSQMEDVDSE